MIRSLLSVLTLALITTATHAEDTITTRFGSLTINDENILLFEGQVLDPIIQGNNSLSVLGTYRLANSDAVLIQDNGGTACPALLYFVELSSGGLKATQEFGSCSDLVEVKQADETIIVTMPDKETGEMVSYRYKAGVLKEIKVSAKSKVKQPSTETNSSGWHIVTAEPNLVVRSKPSVSGGKLGKVPHGGKIKVLERTEERDSIGGRNGVWVKIEWQDTTGYAFDAFLEPIGTHE